MALVFFFGMISGWVVTHLKGSILSCMCSNDKEACISDVLISFNFVEVQFLVFFFFFPPVGVPVQKFEIYQFE